MDIYADLPSSNATADTPSGESNAAGASTAGTSSSSPAAAKGSWAHSKFQGMIAKRRTATAATSRMAPPPLLKRPGPPPAALKDKKDLPRPKPKPKPGVQAITPPPPVTNRPKSWDMGFGDIDDDYDPFQPNDYMEYCRERINRKKQEERDRELKIIMEEQERERKRADEERAATIRKIQEAAAKAHEAATAAGGGRGVPGPAPVPGLGAGRDTPGGLGGIGAGDIAAMEASMGRGRGRGMSNLPAWMTKGTGASSAAPAPTAAASGPAADGGLQEPPTPGRKASPPTPGQFENAAEGARVGRFGPQTRAGGGPSGGAGAGAAGAESGMNFAERMMAKMGHKEGMGLGASRQGISQPLQSLSAGGGMGVIDMHHSDKKRMGDAAPPAPLAPPARKKRGLFSNPTRVLLLKNMVGPGEVDDDLEGETQGECERFGPVRRCLIYEIKGGETPDTERVRIFVAFEKQESAVKAYLEMNGRFFGGRQIAASFYKEEKFDGLDLEPQPDEEKS